MKKYIPYGKLSKKEKRRLDSARRGTWGPVAPVTRKPQNSKAYSRQKAQNWKKELPDSVSCFVSRLPGKTCPAQKPLMVRIL